MTKREGFSRREMRMLSHIAEERHEHLKGGRLWRQLDFLLSLALLVVLALGVRRFLAEPIRVDGDSMVPTLTDGDIMLVEKLRYLHEDPARGDILICYYPGYDKSCVKRVIALGGETVEVRDGKVRIDGAPLNESAYWRGDLLDVAPVTVPEGAVFVMGDNRGVSKDSRNPSVGPIPREKIVGRVFFTLPLGK